MAETVLALRGIRVQHGKHTVLEIPYLDVIEGEVLGILGPNGAGKTTLLRIMGLLLRPTTGKVLFQNEEVTRANALRLRRRMASVFHEPLLLNATVYDNVALGLKLRGVRGRELENRVRPWLERLGIADLNDRQARTLSGGEAQRTSLARAFVLNPNVLLLDEPFSSLDQPTREALLADLQQIFKLTGITTVFVTHERQEAMTLSNRVAILSRSRLLQLSENREVFTHPINEDVAKIVGQRQ
jgi:tungstate transport system ATP-binding protein